MSLDYLAHLRSESDRFSSLLRDADRGLPVPSCPEWTADDLLWHLGEVQWFWGTIVRDRLQDPDAAEQLKPERPESHEGLATFFDESTALLQTALAETDPAAHVWMWSDEQTAGYVRRRMAHEALIHRLDAELTVGEVTPLDPALASDGVHEALTKFFGGVPEWGTFTPEGSVVRAWAEDTGLELHVLLGRFTGTSPNTGTTYDEPALDVVEAAEPTATVRGSAARLDAWVWGRADASALTVEGDRAAFGLLQTVLDVGVD